jgi:hypothetical protein
MIFGWARSALKSPRCKPLPSSHCVAAGSHSIVKLERKNEQKVQFRPFANIGCLAKIKCIGREACNSHL